MPEPITTKKRMYELLRAGALGNTLRTWDSSRAMLADGYSGEVGVRTLCGPAGPFIIVPSAFWAETYLREMTACGYIRDESDALWCETFPDHLLCLQGELCEMAPHGLVLAWDDTPGLNMREAAAKGFRTAYGLTAREILRTRLSAASYDDLMELLEMYPDHVIEFSAAECFVGDQPGRNAVV